MRTDSLPFLQGKVLADADPGLASVVANANGCLVAHTLYNPWGAVRYQSGSLLTQYTYTGQYSHVDDFGLLFYNARWYDPALGRFAQADTVVPGAGNPLAWDRYAYVNNNPLRFSDPTGHWLCEGAYGECNGPPRGYNTVTHYLVRRPTDLVGRSGPGAQYVPVYSPIYESNNNGYPQHYNLCGHLSFAVIYETETGEENTLGVIWEKLPTKPNETTSSSDLVALANSFPGWSATVKWFDWRDPYQDVSSTLANGSYVIVGSTLEKASGRLVSGSLEKLDGYVGHWVVVARIDVNGVGLYNPYTNTYQDYTWKEFTETDGVAIVITPPKGPKENIPEW